MIVIDTWNIIQFIKKKFSQITEMPSTGFEPRSSDQKRIALSIRPRGQTKVKNNLDIRACGKFTQCQA